MRSLCWPICQFVFYKICNVVINCPFSANRRTSKFVCSPNVSWEESSKKLQLHRNSQNTTGTNKQGNWFEVCRSFVKLASWPPPKLSWKKGSTIHYISIMVYLTFNIQHLHRKCTSVEAWAAIKRASEFSCQRGAAPFSLLLTIHPFKRKRKFNQNVKYQNLAKSQRVKYPLIENSENWNREWY